MVAARSSGHWRRLLAMAALLPPLVLGPAKAETEKDVLQLASGPNSYVDLYLQNPKVSGNLLVGVRWARKDENPAAPGKFDWTNIRLIVPAGLAARTACVDIASKDGRYTAENLYVVPPNVARQPALYTRTKFAAELGIYDIDSIAVMIRTASACDAADFGDIIPAVLVPRDGDPAAALSGVPELVVYVNADPERVLPSLQKKGSNNDIPGTCSSAGNGVSISYSAVCRLTPGRRLQSGQYTLRLAIKERFKKVEARFDLLISE